MTNSIQPNELGPFHDEVSDLYEHIMQSAFAEDDKAIVAHPQHMTEGAECYVFQLSDKQHIAKFPLVSWMEIDQEDRYPNPFDNEYVLDRSLCLFDIRIEALVEGLGAHGLEQIVAYDTATIPCVVVEAIPTRPHRSLYAARYSVRDYHTLLDAINITQERDLDIDPIAANFLYNPQDGFQIIDYALLNPDTLSRQKVLNTFGSPQVLDPVAHPANARAYHQACREQYGPGVADALAESWQDITGAEHIL